MKYTFKGVPQNLTGVIAYNLTETLIFKVNNQTEVSVRYSNIQSIEKIKSFASYMKKAENYFNNREFQKAHNVVFKLKEYSMFKLDEQIDQIEKFINKCKSELFKKSRECEIV
jgi:hypothetical protein